MDLSISEDAEEVNDKLHYRLPIITYFISGSITAYTYICVQQDLYKFGILSEQLNDLKYLQYPIYLQLLICPFMDSYFSNSLGIRKTYLTLALLGLIFTCFISSILLPGLYNYESISKVVVIFLMIIIFTTILSLNTDAWIIENVHKANFSMMAAVKLICYNLGVFLTLQITEKLSETHVSAYLKIISIASLLYLIYLHIYIQEVSDYRSQCNLKQIKKKVKTFINKLVHDKFHPFQLFLFFNLIGTGLAENYIPNKEQQLLARYPKLIYIIILTSGLAILLSVYLYNRVQKLSYTFITAMVLRNINNLIFIFIYRFQEDFKTYFLYYSIISAMISAFQSIIIMTLIYVFSNSNYSTTILAYLFLLTKIYQEITQIYHQLLGLLVFLAFQRQEFQES